MSDYIVINNRLRMACGAREERIINKTLFVHDYQFTTLRFLLFKMGTVQEEDFEHGILVATLPGGFKKKNTATAAFQIKGNKLKLAVYAKEGMFDQHTSEGVVKDIELALSDFIDEGKAGSATGDDRIDGDGEDEEEDDDEEFGEDNDLGNLYHIESKCAVVIGVLTVALVILMFSIVAHVIAKHRFKNEYEELCADYNSIIREYNELVDRYSALEEGIVSRGGSKGDTQIEYEKEFIESFDLYSRNHKDAKNLKSRVQGAKTKLSNVESIYQTLCRDNCVVWIESYNSSVEKLNTLYTRLSGHETITTPNQFSKLNPDQESVFRDDWDEPLAYLNYLDSVAGKTEDVDEEYYQFCLSSFDEVTNDYNTVAEEYNNLLKITSVDFVQGMKKTARVREVITEQDLATKTRYYVLNGIDMMIYDTDNLARDYLVAKQITNPDEKWIKERLQGISDISDMEAVTVSNDPNGLLNKNGGYSSCIYFSLSEINQNGAPGTSAVDRGTDYGGAIETFRNMKDALNRCDYLSQFDSTLLYTGSYAVIGTMVVRTSYKLSNERQIELTDSITEKLTELR